MRLIIDRCLRCGWLVLLLLMSVTAHQVQAQQLVLDETYTATASNTTDSHFFVKPPPGSPANWRVPVDYGNGTAYVRLDVLSKPSTKKTFYNICFEGNSGTCCMPLSPPYTAPGVVTFSAQFPSFWNYSTVDWTKGEHQVALILKDENQAKVQADPAFYPTNIHVTITIVPPGGTYVPPADTQDAGTPKDAGVLRPTDAGIVARDAGGGPIVGADSGSRTPNTADASVKHGTDAGTPASSANAGAGWHVDAAPTGASAGAGAVGGGSGTTAQPSESSAASGHARAGCSIAGAGSEKGLAAFWFGSGLLLFARRRRRKPHAQH